jgi:tRNA 2-thiouridine synthesizing protein A
MIANIQPILIDARGLSCPQPAILARQAISQEVTGKVEVLVDMAAQRDNIVRIAMKASWSATAEETSDGSIRICLQK